MKRKPQQPKGPAKSAKRVAIYARVSTPDQDPEVQLRELRAYCERRGWDAPRELVDHGISGKRASRPALDELMGLARTRAVDTIVVWALDRFGRSLRNMVLALDELSSLGVAFVVPSQGIDTSDTNPAGRLTVQILSAVAEFERALIRDRVMAGLAKARAFGKRLGRAPIQRNAVNVEEAGRLMKLGASLRAAAEKLGVNRETLRRALGRARGA